MSTEQHDSDLTDAVEVDSLETAVEPDTAAAPIEPVEHNSAAKPASGKRKPSPAGQAVSGGDVDTVSLEHVVYKNKFSRKSLSVHHVQRRLAELGYPDAYTDKDGWYGDLTQLAVDAYRRDNGLAGDGYIDMAFLLHLFADDSNVQVVD